LNYYTTNQKESNIVKLVGKLALFINKYSEARQTVFKIFNNESFPANSHVEKSVASYYGLEQIDRTV